MEKELILHRNTIKVQALDVLPRELDSPEPEEWSEDTDDDDEEPLEYSDTDEDEDEGVGGGNIERSDSDPFGK